MAIITVYQHRSSGGVIGEHRRKPGKREAVEGWTKASTRRNTQFLGSIVVGELTGLGFAFTLTLRDCPATADAWHKIRRAFLMRLDRRGLIRLHWVTEWQRRGVPHLHGAAWFELSHDDRAGMIQTMELIRSSWLAVGQDYRPGRLGQNAKVITGAVGWFQYLAKHASRGVDHYQRSRANMPAGWKRSGRVWGYTGTWPRREGLRFDVSNSAFHAYRRIVRAWRIADARAARDPDERRRRVPAAKAMLKDSDEDRSRVRGVSEWVPEGAALRIIYLLAAMGHEIESV